ncbi:hypothetical protein ES703_75080 [subsurface metagenome]
MIALEVISPSTSDLQSLASAVPIGQRGLVHIWGRNDTPVTQALGISWLVRDPDGAVVEEYSDWSYGHGPGDDHEFIGGRFDINKAGTYTLEADLLMGSPDNPVVVDSYMGALCSTTTEVPPEYVLIQHTIHPAAYVYEDEAEVCVIEFPLTPDQLPFTQWGGLKLAETFANAVEAEGNSLLEVWVYEDTTPMLWTNYRIEIKAAVASEEPGVAVWPWLVPLGAKLLTLPWGFIIKGTLTLLGIWLVGWVIEKLIKAVDRVIHKPSALTDEVIEGLEREDLIPMILYKAPRVDYEVSPEELEAMSDDGLRALLKELRDRQVEEISPWGILALVGGLGIVGVGAAVAFGMARKEE